MKLLTTITDKDILKKEIHPPKKYSIRRAGRAIVFNSENKIAILKATKYNFHKLPGGGLEKGENIQTALEREIAEEIGIELDKDKLILIEVKESPKFTENIHALHFVFASTVKENKKIVLNFDCDNESDEYRWFSISNLPENMFDKKEDIW
jgi:8-oxo-dGTP pyrophosphatase MutT (NUDIX family)